MPIQALLAPLASTDTDWSAVGVVLQLAGAFLLGNALLFRHPRELVAERFGARARPLVAIRESIFQRLEVSIGFAYLIAGLGLELFGRVHPLPAGSEPGFPVFWVALLALATVALLALGWWWSSRSFRRHVAAEMQRRAPDLERDPDLAREIGELFGVEAAPNETVASYAEKVRRASGLAPRPRVVGNEITLERHVEPDR